MNNNSLNSHAFKPLSLALAIFLCSCQSNPAQWSKSTAGEIDQAMSEAVTQTPPAAPQVPPEVSSALLPPLTAAAGEQAALATERHFDLAANNTPARQVFMSLVEGTPYSMVVHPDVTGTITLNLNNVTIEEVLDTLRQIYGYEYRRSGNKFLILGQGMQTRIYPVNYLNFKRKGQSSTLVSSSALTDVQSTTSSGNDDQSTATSSTTRSTRLETSSESDFWKGLSEALKTIIGDKNGRNVVVNPDSGLVVVRAMPDELRIVEDFLHITHATVNRQVMLEAKIIEVELKDGFQSGINWAALGSVDGTNILAGQTGGGSIFSGSGVSEIAGQTGTLRPDTYSPVKSTLTSAFGGVFSLQLSSSDFTAFFELLQSQGKVQVLSSPRVSTVNDQKAVIKVGGDEFFVTGVKNQPTVVNNVTVNSPEIELTPFFSGIALDVTPHIDENNDILLHIHPTVSTVTQRDKNFMISDDAYNLPLALSTIQETDNVVRSDSGQIIVIGGLMKEASTDENASLPLLGDLPLIGNMFKHKKITRIKKELIILLRPTIINNKTWNGDIKKAQDRMTNLRQGKFE